MTTEATLSLPGSDISGDGAVDILWRNLNSGQNVAWYMDNTTLSGGTAILSLPQEWTMAGTGDFNGDGQSDLLWQNRSSGDVYAWYLDRGNLIGGNFIANLPTDWRVAGTGDFNGDDRTDLLWSNQTSGELHVWYMQGITPTTGQLITTMPTDWQVRATGDFNNDGQDDLVWSNANSGDTYVWFMTGATPTGSAFVATMPTSWQVSGTGDFNSDGQTDLLWWNKGSGETYTWFMNGATPLSSALITTIPAEWQPLATARGGLADLTLQNALVPGSVANGDTVALGVTVVNQGSKIATPNTLKYYLSSDTSFDANDRLLGEISVGALRTGQSFTAEASFTYDTATMGTGAKHILFVADADGAVLERDETNNLLPQGFTVSGGNPPPTGDVDLLIQNPVVPSNFTAGQEVIVSAKVINQGTTTAAASTLSVYVSSSSTFSAANATEVVSRRISNLGAGLSADETLTFTYKPEFGDGAKFIHFVTDSGAEVSETNETNNTAVQAVTVAPALNVDLTLTSYTAPTSFTAGQPVTAQATVLNQGTTTSGNSTLSLYVSNDQTFDAQADILAASINISALNAGSSSQATLNFTYNPSWGTGTKYFYLVADANTDIAELNETNNVESLTVQVAQAEDIDLVVQTPIVSPTTVNPGSEVQLAARVQNTGTVDAGASTLRIYLSDDTTLDANDQFLFGRVIGDLSGDTSSTVQNFSFNYLTTYGTGAKYVLFVADALNTVIEANETNNVTAVGLTVNTVQPGKDLKVESFLASTQTVTAGQSMSVSGVVLNQGAETAAASTLGFYLSDDAVFDVNDTLLGTRSIGSLGTFVASGAQTVTFNYQQSYGTGNKYILFVADSGQVITESNETNNVEALAITVTAAVNRPDLLATDLTVQSPITDTIILGYNLKNQGNTATNNSFNISYFVSNDQTLDEGDIFIASETETVSLAAGETREKSYADSYNPSWGFGTKYILVAVDSGLSVLELDETNNVTAFQVTVNASAT
ncbi:MAG: CARDB domain-containing protein [Nodosilinea sp.]